MGDKPALHPAVAINRSLTEAAWSVLEEARAPLADALMTDADVVHDVRKALKRWRALLRLAAPFVGEEEADRLRVRARDLARGLAGARDPRSALDALADDLNTPKAFAALHELRGEAVKGAKPAAACLKASAQLIGLLQYTRPEWATFRQASRSVDEIQVVSLIEARNLARKAKDFRESDRIRDELVKMGVVLKDSKDGTTWEIAR